MPDAPTAPAPRLHPDRPAAGPRPSGTPGEPIPQRSRERSRWRLLLGFGLFAVMLTLLTVAIIHFYGRGASLGSYVALIESDLHRREAIATTTVEDSAFLQQQIYGLSRLATETAAAHAAHLSYLTEQDFNIVVYESDSVLFWTNNLAMLPRQLSPRRLPAQSLRVLENGQYLVKRKRLTLFGYREFDIVTLLPIRQRYRLKSAYLRDGFVGAPRIPDAVGLVRTPTAFGIRARDGETVAYLSRLRAFNDWRYQAWMFGLHIGGVLLISLVLFRLATKVKRRFGTVAGVVSILASAYLLHRLMASNQLSKLYPDLGFLAELFDVDLMTGSLASFVVRVVLAMWLVTYFHRSYRGWRPEGHSPFFQWAVTALHYLAIIGGAAALTLVIQSTIESPGLEFDFENVLNLSTTGTVALIAMLTLVFAHFLFSHRLMIGISEIGLSKRARLTANAAAMVIAGGALAMIDFPLSLPEFLLGMGAFMLVYDLFIDTGESNILWLFFWLVVLSIYSAVLFFIFNEQKDLGRRLEYARALAVPHDAEAESALVALDSSLRRDLKIQNLLLGTEPEEFRLEALPSVRRVLIEQGYLYNNYKFAVAVAPRQPRSSAPYRPPRRDLGGAREQGRRGAFCGSATDLRQRPPRPRLLGRARLPPPAHEQSPAPIQLRGLPGAAPGIACAVEVPVRAPDQ